MTADDYRFVCKGRFEHIWYTSRFGGVYCARCSLKAERSCIVNSKRVGYHCEENR